MNKVTAYTPKPGDKVTSPLLVGEWEVIGDESSHHPMAYRVKVGNETREARVWVSDLTPVAPPIPTEPPIGSVVRAHGRMWFNAGHGLWQSTEVPKGAHADWSDLAADPYLSPVVAVDDAIDSLVDVDMADAADAIQDSFGFFAPACGDPDCQHAPDGGNHPVTQ